MNRLVVPDEMKVGRFAPEPSEIKDETSATTGSRSIRLLSWVFVIGGVATGFVILIFGMAAAQSAPQEAVVVSLAIACAVLPYCFARAVTEITRDS